MAALVTLVALVALRAAAATAGDEGFEPLFDGLSLDGWVIESHADSETHPDGRPVWRVRDGAIECDGLGFGFLRTQAAFADFTLRLEFLLGTGPDGRPTNSGLGLRTGPFDRRRSRTTRPSIRGWEIQLIDDAPAPPSATSSGSLYRYLAPAEAALRPAGAWNELEVTMVGPRIRVTINGRLIHDLDQTTLPRLRTKPLSGHVALQNHGGPVRFRNLRLRRESAGDTAQAALDAQAAILAARGGDIGIRGVLRYALEAAGRGADPVRIDEALRLARSMQVVDPADPHQGNFRWRLGDAAVRDANACEFAGQLLAMLRLEDDGRLVPRPGGPRLSAEGRALVDTMAREALTAIERRRVEPGYTNIALLHAWNLLALGDLGGPATAAAGIAAWREWRAFTLRCGVTEFLAPTYLGIDLDALALIADHAPDAAVRGEAEGAIEYLWQGAACHWLPAAQRLAGPRARDADWLFGRGYADLHLADAGWLTLPPRPEGAGWLPGAPQEGLLLYRSACRREPPGSLADEILGLAPRFVVERTGHRPWQRISDWVGRTASIGVAGEGRGGEDKTFVLNLPPPGWSPAAGPWRGANVTLVIDGHGDPWGLPRPPGAVAPQAAPRHLRAYLVSSQEGPHVTALWFFDPRRPAFRIDEPLTSLAAHLLLPAALEVWGGEGILAPGAALPADAVVFLRGADCAAGVRFIAPEDPDLRAGGIVLAEDPGRPDVRRLTARFADGPPDRGLLLGLDVELLEGCDDAGFARFREAFAARPVRLVRESSRAVVEGALGVALDLGAGPDRPRRLAFSPRLPEGALLLLEGREIGRDALEPPEPR
ncbi:MAG: DUF1080 domain-containing protein [Planctomycetaceae bacterium]